MTLKEIIDNYNNIEELRVNENIPEYLLKSAKSTLENDMLEKVLNILEYRKELIEKDKTTKLEELDEYLFYCLYLARINEIYLDNKLKVKIRDKEMFIYES